MADDKLIYRYRHEAKNDYPSEYWQMARHQLERKTAMRLYEVLTELGKPAMVKIELIEKPGNKPWLHCIQIELQITPHEEQNG